MFQHSKPRGPVSATIATMELIFHVAVREIRQKNGNAILAILSAVTRALIMLAVFYLFFQLLGLRSAGLRGDFMLYLASGIFLFLTHNGAISAITGADGPMDGMLQHAPLNTAITISGAALANLYLQVLTVVSLLFIYHTAVTPIYIDDMIGAFGMFLLAWASGCSVGLLLMAFKPWAPGIVGKISMLYRRANMIASGKMFVANALPGYMVAMFDWNPLFHTIDQARGFVFNNYFPHNSSIEYPIYLTLTLLTLGLIAEFFTRQHVSPSWEARR
ncbi:ABC transporter permease [Poseidonocella sedimentorum]|uniref:ABC-type polysaccharide/polyol phosphate export permease n=1 Tax=Poseidonocella sedimentorum TaxID=871652 RepID=A0A1I6D453_9RHOB|nr:ABC transporter permease [Poseidonocella sedimentorum]SFR00225.1 ABC-type polysaccharide/polyol phosphate export permease [Poseidonocella sedimentorum]